MFLFFTWNLCDLSETSHELTGHMRPECSLIIGFMGRSDQFSQQLVMCYASAAR